MRIHALQLFGVKARRRTADRLQREPFYGLGAADNLVVAMSPAKAEQILLQRFGEDAQLVPLRLYPQCPIALGQLCPVGPLDQRGGRRLGREPGRESAGQSVEIEGVAGSLNTKKKQREHTGQNKK